ncbi:MAG: hypothetical protein V3W19_01445 [Desulfatiglandales bacterium]
MITDEEKEYILAGAYIPEHIVGLMTRVSDGEPFLIENYFCCRKEDWIIVVGYPLQRDFIISEFEILIDNIKKRFRPRFVSLMAPEMPPSISASCQEKENDEYYTLDIPMRTIKSGLRRAINKALENLTVERSTEMREEHKELMLEFVERAKPPPRVRELLFKMEGYVGRSKNSIVLNALDKKNNLTAFYVVDLAAKDFSAYVIGCHSKKNYVAGASDLLCHEMIKISMEYGKNYIHLGLGVNDGIRRFKKKWGGVPTRRYEMCELVTRKPSILDAVRFTR